MFYKIVVLQNSQNSDENTCAEVSLVNIVLSLQTFKNTFFTELRATASVVWPISFFWLCLNKKYSRRKVSSELQMHFDLYYFKIYKLIDENWWSNNVHAWYL